MSTFDRRSKLTRRGLLLGSAALAGTGAWVAARRAARAESPVPARKLVVVVATGGWDTTYNIDPKPGLGSIDVPTGSIVDYAGLPIFDHSSRPATAAFFDAYASTCSVVHGIQIQSITHSDCAKRLLTGTASDASPDVGAIAAWELGRELPTPYLVLGRTSFPGPYASIVTRAGTSNQLGTLLDPAAGLPVGDPFDPPPSFVLSPGEAAAIAAYRERRAERERDSHGGSGRNRQRYQDFLTARERADALREVANLGELEYARDLAVQAQLAADALEQGLCRVAHLEAGDFDTHETNTRQSSEHEQLFTGLRILLDELAARPGEAAGSKLLDETVVAVVSEMGRTPKLNAAGGKDHWPVASALLCGAGVGGGRVLGGSDEAFGARRVDLESGAINDEGQALQYANFAAGLLEAVGVDAGGHLPNAEPFHGLRA